MSPGNLVVMFGVMGGGTRGCVKSRARTERRRYDLCDHRRFARPLWNKTNKNILKCQVT